MAYINQKIASIIAKKRQQNRQNRVWVYLLNWGVHPW